MEYATFESQQEFVRTGQTLSPTFRKATLRSLRHLLQSHEAILYEAIQADFGKSKFDTYTTEIGFLYSEIDYFLHHLDRLCRPRRVATNLLNLPGRSRLYSEPLGSVLIIGAWNYPYQLSLLPAIDAIAAGNACTIKPSEVAPHTMHCMAELINNAFPSHYLHVEEGGVPETTQLLEFPFDKIFFTGSARVGRIVSQAAAKHLTPVTLELGGKSPVLVTRSADIDRAARRLVWGKWLNGGQTCVAPDYLLVEDSVADQLLTRIVHYLDRYAYTDQAPHYVRLIDRRHYDRIAQLIDPNKLYYGGSHNEATRYIGPTILTHVTWDDPSMQEEIFGPILPVMRFTDLAATLETLRGQDKPLSAYLFSGERSEQRLFCQRFSFGGGCINDTVMHLTNRHLPFGGVGSSGTGHYHGRYGFDCFSHQKSILKRSLWGEPSLKYAPYSATKLRWIKHFF